MLAAVIGPVVDVGWLRAHPEVVVVDGRWYLDGGAAKGRAAYGAGHVPGARFVDLDRCEAGSPSPADGRHPLPAPEVFAACCTALGIGEGSTVVAYDDTAGAAAARMVWLLRAAGVDAALLDGGLAAWDGDLEAGDPPPPPRPARPLQLDAWPAHLLATAEEVGGAPLVLDARAPERYRGEVEPIDPQAGHVPGARNVPFAGNTGPDGCFLPIEELRARYEAAGVRPGADVVAYCGSGVTACHTLLALEHAGLGPGRLYAGSWSQWSADPDRPVATGPEP
jgi:thiosulfate/3-mercaptopyruvate sulfurtransferase